MTDQRPPFGQPPDPAHPRWEDILWITVGLLLSQSLISAADVYARALHTTIRENAEFADNDDLAHDEEYKRLDCMIGFYALLIIWARSQYVPEQVRALLGEGGGLDPQPPNASRLGAARAIDRRKAGHMKVAETQFSSEQRRIAAAAIKFGLVHPHKSGSGPKPLVATELLHLLMRRFFDEYIPLASGFNFGHAVIDDDHDDPN